MRELGVRPRAEGVPHNMGPRTAHPAALAWALFFLAPFVGEWLLGNQPASDLASLLVLAPMYGGGALLVREIGRRSGRGWPAMLLLAAAYALIEEGPIDQMIYNPRYLGLSSFHGMLVIPGTGVSLSLVLASLALHTVWSICTPIALIEAFDPSNRPWLQARGLVAVAAVFVVGSTLLTWVQADEFHFFASAWQLGGTWLVIAALVLLAFTVPTPVTRPGRPPIPLVTAIAAFAVTSTYWAESLITSYLIDVSPWLDLLTWCVLLAAGFWQVRSWSRCQGWGRAHRVALASGALLTYAWVGFFNAAELDIPLTEAVIGSTAFAASAVALVVRANQRTAADASPFPV